MKFAAGLLGALLFIAYLPQCTSQVIASYPDGQLLKEEVFPGVFNYTFCKFGSIVSLYNESPMVSETVDLAVHVGSKFITVDSFDNIYTVHTNVSVSPETRVNLKLSGSFFGGDPPNDIYYFVASGLNFVNSPDDPIGILMSTSSCILF